MHVCEHLSKLHPPTPHKRLPLGLDVYSLVVQLAVEGVDPGEEPTYTLKVDPGCLGRKSWDAGHPEHV